MSLKSVPLRRRLHLTDIGSTQTSHTDVSKDDPTRSEDQAQAGELIRKRIVWGEIDAQGGQQTAQFRTN
jgi:hypothetical protein